MFDCNKCPWYYGIDHEHHTILKKHHHALKTIIVYTDETFQREPGPYDDVAKPGYCKLKTVVGEVV